MFIKKHARKIFLPVIAVLVTLIVSPKLFPVAQEGVPDQQPPEPQLHLAIIPHTPTVMAGNSLIIDIVGKAINLNPTAAEIHLSFDPEYFELEETSLAPGSILNTILPNCAQGTIEPPCPASINIQEDRVSFILSRPCTEDGCDLTPPSGIFTLATITLNSKPNTTGTTTISLIDITTDPEYYTISSAIDHDWDITGNRATTSITVTECDLSYDFDADGQISVSDVMKAAALWLSDISQPLYNGQFDLTKTGVINISDVQQIANTWGETCTPTPPPSPGL